MKSHQGMLTFSDTSNRNRSLKNTRNNNNNDNKNSNNKVGTNQRSSSQSVLIPRELPRSCIQNSAGTLRLKGGDLPVVTSGKIVQESNPVLSVNTPTFADERAGERS